MISRIVWCVKYSKQDVETEEFILADEKSLKYLNKVTNGKLVKRFQASSYLIECVALFIVFYVYYAGLLIVGLVGFGLAVTGHEPLTSAGAGKKANTSILLKFPPTNTFTLVMMTSFMTIAIFTKDII